MTGKQRALIFLTAGVFAIAGIAAFGWIMWRTVKSVTSPAPATQADRGMVVTADKLAPLGFDRANPRGEILTTVRMGLSIENPADAQMLLAPVIEESKRQYGTE